MDIDGDSGDDDQPKPSIPLGLQHLRGRTPKAIAVCGPLTIFIIAGSLCAPLGNRVKHPFDQHAVENWRDEYGQSAMITAIGVGRWHLRRADDTYSSFARDLQKSWKDRASAVGWVSYEILHRIVPLTDALPLNGRRALQVIRDLSETHFEDAAAAGTSQTLHGWLEQWKQLLKVPSFIFLLGHAWCWARIMYARFGL